jgi:hypothetical protein
MCTNNTLQIVTLGSLQNVCKFHKSPRRHTSENSIFCPYDAFAFRHHPYLVRPTDKTSGAPCKQEMCSAANVFATEAPCKHEMSSAASVFATEAPCKHEVCSSASVFTTEAPCKHEMCLAASVFATEAPCKHEMCSAASVFATEVSNHSTCLVQCFLFNGTSRAILGSSGSDCLLDLDY